MNGGKRISGRSFHRVPSLDGPSPSAARGSHNDLASLASARGSRRTSTGARPRRSKSLKGSINSSSSSNEAAAAVQDALRRAKRRSSSRPRSSSTHQRGSASSADGSLHEMELLQSVDALDELERQSILSRASANELTGSCTAGVNAEEEEEDETKPLRVSSDPSLGGSLSPKQRLSPLGSPARHPSSPRRTSAENTNSSSPRRTSSNIDGNDPTLLSKLPTSYHRGSTHFSAQLARRFLDESEDDDGGPIETFQDEDNDNASFATSDSNEPSMASASDLEWNPEVQRQQHDEWRKLRLKQQHQNGNHKNTDRDAASFPSRPDLRQVDQTVNLMDASRDEDAEAPPSRRQQQKQKQGRGLLQKKNSQNSSLVDVWLDNTGGNDTSASTTDMYGRQRSRRKSKKNKRRGGYRTNTCCQDLFCSKMTIFLAIAALLGAFVAWRTGAFWESEDAARTDDDILYGDGNATTITAPTSGGWDSHASELEDPIMEDLRELLLQLNLLPDPDVLESTTSPQYLALHWVAHLGADPDAVLASPNHKLAHPNSNNNDADSDSDSDTLMMMTNEDCIRLVAYALAVLYYSTNGFGDTPPPYTLDKDPSEHTAWHRTANWMKPVPICTWHGVTCDENTITESTVVSGLNLTNNDLQGTLPLEVFQILFSLETLDVSRNNLIGSLPSDITINLDDTTTTTPALQTLWLNSNKLTGSIPTTWGTSMTNLRSIQLEHNQLTGILPPEINNWVDLKLLSVHNNQLEGKFPYILGLQKLEYVLIFSNEFSQGLPYEFFRIKTLKELEVQNNQFTGTIPPEIENLHHLEVLRLEENAIVGTLPDLFDRLTNLVQISVDSNKISGTIPETIGSLTNLKLLMLDKNQFTGTLPSDFADLTRLQEMRCDDNQLTGTMPKGFCDLKEDHALVFATVDCDQVKGCSCCGNCK